MTPRLTADDVPDGGLMDAVVRSNGLRLLAVRMTLTNDQDVRLDKPGGSVGRSGLVLSVPRMGRSVKSPTSHRHLMEVVALSTEVKMGRIDAWRVVAGMEDFQAVRDRTMGPFVRHSMSSGLPTIDAEQSVVGPVASTRPFPASIAHEEQIIKVPTQPSLHEEIIPCHR